MPHLEYDAIVVGSGPNGLSAAITLQQAGLGVLLIEGKATIGGGMRTQALTLPGFLHDVCSAIHPMAAGSPFFNGLPLGKFGLEFLYPAVYAAHPFDDGSCAVLKKSIAETIGTLKQDAGAYEKLMLPLLRNWEDIASDVLGPLRLPGHPLAMARFSLKAFLPAVSLAKRFAGIPARGLWAGMAAHAMEPLSNVSSSAIGLVLLAMGHLRGWPVVKGGSGRLADALAAYFMSLGGKIETGTYITSLDQLPRSRAVILDVTPRQLLQMAGHKLSGLYQRQLRRYRYGMGVFKIDWALREAIPFRAADCRQAGTVHLGGTLEEIACAEKATWKGTHPERPFVLLAQQSMIDPSRAPRGAQTAWAYCHVPNGSELDMTQIIENQVERFAPGFRDVILARHVFSPSEMEAYNPNYIGGDINGGAIDIGQLFTRPALRRSVYRTSSKGLYLCSASTPPGGGVHGMCGYHAANRVLKDLFNTGFPARHINSAKSNSGS